VKQQINLYQAEFQEKQVELPAEQIYLLAGGLLLILVLSSVVLSISNTSAQSKLDQLTAAAATLKQTNDALDQQLKSRAVDQQLQASANEAAKQMQARQDILLLVERTESAAQTVKFSELLAGLGRQHVSGLWLSRIEIANAGQELHLEGNALQPGLIPEFIGRLNKEPSYAGREFRKVVVRRSKDAPAVLNFVITTADPSSERLMAFKEQAKPGVKKQ
jgi:outer membrane murein-binding lipoprotein Lpp